MERMCKLVNLGFQGDIRTSFVFISNFFVSF